MTPTTVYLPTTIRHEAEALARAVGLQRGPLLRRLIERGLEAVGGDPVKLLIQTNHRAAEEAAGKKTPL